MTEHNAKQPASCSSFPLSEDEFRKEEMCATLSIYQSCYESSTLHYEKIHNEKNQGQSILNFIEFHLANNQTSCFDENLLDRKKYSLLRSNSLSSKKSTSHEFMKKELLRYQKKIFGFLKFFISKLANSKILSLFKDYYPKVLI